MRTATKLIDLVSKKTILHMQHTFWYISLPLFCPTKAWNFLVTCIYFMEELSHELSKNFVASVPVHFYFFHCHLFSSCWQLAFLIFSLPLWNFHQQNFFPLFSITCSSSFSVIHVSELQKSGWPCDFLPKKTPWVAFGLPYLLIELFYMTVLVMWKFGWEYMVMWLGNQIFLPKHMRELRYDTKGSSVVVKWWVVQYICLGPLASVWESHVIIFFEIAVFKLF